MQHIRIVIPVVITCFMVSHANGMISNLVRRIPKQNLTRLFTQNAGPSCFSQIPQVTSTPFKSFQNSLISSSQSQNKNDGNQKNGKSYTLQSACFGVATAAMLYEQKNKKTVVKDKKDESPTFESLVAWVKTTDTETLIKLKAYFETLPNEMKSVLLQQQNDLGNLLHIATWEKNIEAMRILISAGAPVNDENNNGTTPILMAAQNNDAAAISLLIKAGADLTAEDDLERTPLQRAVHHAAHTNSLQVIECVALLMKHYKNQNLIKEIERAKQTYLQALAMYNPGRTSDQKKEDLKRFNGFVQQSEINSLCVSFLKFFSDTLHAST